MDLSLVFLYTAVGTLVGALGVWFLMRPADPSASAASQFAALQQQVQSSEASLAAAVKNASELREKIAEQDQALSASSEVLETRKEAAGELDGEKLRRADAERRAEEFASQAARLTQRCAELESSAAGGTAASEAELAMLTRRLEGSEAALATAAVEIQTLREQVAEQNLTLRQNEDSLGSAGHKLDEATSALQRESARSAAADRLAEELACELATVRRQCAELEATVREGEALRAEEARSQAASFEMQLSTEKRRFEEQSERMAWAENELTGLRSANHDMTQRNLEIQTAAEIGQERARQVSVHYSELQRDWSRLETSLREQAQSTAAGIQCLAATHRKLSQMLVGVCPGPLNGAGETGTPLPDSAEDLDNVGVLRFGHGVLTARDDVNACETM